MTLERRAPVEDAEAATDDLKLWSVTTILKAIGSNDALIGWAANQTATAAIDDHETWQSRLEHEGRESAIKYLAGARYRRPDDELGATDLGTQFHTAAETLVLDGERPTDLHPQVAPLVAQFEHWLDQFSPTIEAAELTIYHPAWGYAGTLDAIIELDGSRYVVDYKTSAVDLDSRGNPKRPWPTVALQLAAYRYARFAAAWRPRRFSKWSRRYYLLNETEKGTAQPIPEVDGGLCIYVTPERCEAFAVRCGEQEMQFFGHALQIARWEFQASKTAISKVPLVPPVREEAVV
jgi:hypothetical protein|tara:strand:+ start:1303 stop:2178 length:876 start_codon:yes stop_codon:yes gene_type:complete